MTKALVILSGGQDSTTCLFWAKHRYQEVAAISFYYGQRHERELESAADVCRLAGVTEHRVVATGGLVGTSPLVDPNAPLEQYKDWQSLPGGLEKTFVPMRNLTFLALAANRAVATGCHTIVTGVCEEDYGGYPDCRQQFITAAETVIRLALDEPWADFHIATPLMTLTKAASVKLALGLPGCYEALGYTHTAYDGAFPPTGSDHATLLRAKGFEQAGVPDPLLVRAWLQTDLQQLPKTPNYEAYADVFGKAAPSLVIDRSAVLGFLKLLAGVIRERH